MAEIVVQGEDTMKQKLLLVIVLLLAASAVHAKLEPYIEDSEAEWGSIDAAWEVPSPLAFNGMYGHLESETDVDAFSYTFEEPTPKFSVQVSVPVCGTLFEDFYPSAAVIGAGLETPEDVDLPFELPKGMGALVLTEIARTEPRSIIGEASYTRQDYFNLWHLVDIPEAGEYTIAVWSPGALEGAYVLVTGSEHPKMDMSDKAREKERIAAYNLIESGEWIGEDCDAS
jgi:hypothetical protein